MLPAGRCAGACKPFHLLLARCVPPRHHARAASFRAPGSPRRPSLRPAAVPCILLTLMMPAVWQVSCVACRALRAVAAAPLSVARPSSLRAVRTALGPLPAPCWLHWWPGVHAGSGLPALRGCRRRHRRPPASPWPRAPPPSGPCSALHPGLVGPLRWRPHRACRRCCRLWSPLPPLPAARPVAGLSRCPGVSLGRSASPAGAARSALHSPRRAGRSALCTLPPAYRRCCL